jgi:hypothetical protein
MVTSAIELPSGPVPVILLLSLRLNVRNPSSRHQPWLDDQADGARPLVFPLLHNDLPNFAMYYSDIRFERRAR